MAVNYFENQGKQDIPILPGNLKKPDILPVF
jgi:hypothetical protein